MPEKTTKSDGDKGLVVIHEDATELSQKWIDVCQDIKIDKLGESYTFSFYTKGTGTLMCFFYGPSGYIPVVKAEASRGTCLNGTDGHVDIPLTDEWVKCWIHWTIKDSGDLSIPKTVLFRAEKGNDVYVCAPKLERGINYDPVWTPNPSEIILTKSELQAYLDNYMATKTS